MIPVRARAAAAGLVFFGLLYWMAQGPRHAVQKFDEPKPAAGFSLPDLRGAQHDFAEYKGKVVLVDFWATWCPPCIEAVPDLSRLHRDFEDRGFTVVGVAVDAGGKEAVGPFVAKHRMPYPILLGEPSRLRGWAIPGFPTSFLIDRQGRVLRRYIGGVPYSELARDVKAALAP